MGNDLLVDFLLLAGLDIEPAFEEVCRAEGRTLGFPFSSTVASI
jgi:hypothetical protein